MGMHRKAAVLVVSAVIVAGCSNSAGGSGTAPGGSSGGPGTTASAADLARNIPSTQPGVTDTEIRVASLGAVTNAVGADFAQSPKGTQAFFDMVNANGGIYGRKLVISEQLDDQMLKNKQTVTDLVARNSVFAVLPVTAVLFTGAPELAESGIPTFGWLNSEDWAGPPSFFAERGSALCIACGTPQVPYAAREAGAERVGILSYGVEQAKTCADGQRSSFERFPVAEVAFVDDAIPLGSTDYSVQVQKMKDDDIDMVVACMDNNSVSTLAREMKKQQVKTILYVQNGYEADLINNFGDAFEGSYIYTAVAPVESDPAPPGLAEYEKWIGGVEGAKVGEQSIIGWVHAQLLYDGLVAAGPEFTQQSVVAAINQFTSWNANGVVSPIDWTKAHDQPASPVCVSTVRVEGGRFVPVFGEPGKPFTCLSQDQPLPDKAPAS
jgi:branched-chain amino acid transport system substrate-binding protein